MGRQKALAALDGYREHNKFRKNLEQMEDGYNEEQVKSGIHPIEQDKDDFMVESPRSAEESKQETTKKPK